MQQTNLYARVIVPVKFKSELTYIIPASMQNEAVEGAVVSVVLGRGEYTGIISSVTNDPGDYSGKLKEIGSVIGNFSIPSKQMEFRRWVSEYYMCNPGEVLKAALPQTIISQIGVKHRSIQNEPKVISDLPQLSPDQMVAFDGIKEGFSKNMAVLLKGVTGSGKTEIYIHLISEALKKGGNVLMMVPEIAISRQLSKRLEQFFGEDLLIFHSKQTSAAKYKITQRVASTGSKPAVILGLRSALFLPYSSLSTIIVDEEHDPSYKQSEPNPRYQGRDSALMLAKIYGANILLGSATPSLESLYNCSTNKFKLVELKTKYFSAAPPEIIMVDTNYERKGGRMRGSMANSTIEKIKERLEAGEQVMVFRNRRSYSPLVQCCDCGEIPTCKHCNIPLSYHKSKSTLSCHYCGYTKKFSNLCPSCGNESVLERGVGTERVEEEIKELFPEAKIERFDADTTEKKSNEARILKSFAKGETDILIGTQMIGKGFHFKKLTLVVILNSDSMLAIQDFRANERAAHMLEQLAGRAGRELIRGSVIIQTSKPNHIVFKNIRYGERDYNEELKEREEFGYPPYVRLVKLVIRDKNRSRLDSCCRFIENRVLSINTISVKGPVAPLIEKIRGEHIMEFWIKIERSKKALSTKKDIYTICCQASEQYRGSTIFCDADPY